MIAPQHIAAGSAAFSRAVFTHPGALQLYQSARSNRAAGSRTLPIPIQVITLPETAKTLYTTIHKELEREGTGYGVQGTGENVIEDRGQEAEMEKPAIHLSSLIPHPSSLPQNSPLPALSSSSAWNP